MSLERLTEIQWDSDEQSFVIRGTPIPVTAVAIGPLYSHQGRYMDLGKVHEKAKLYESLRPDSYEIIKTGHDVLGNHFDYAPVEHSYVFRLFRTWREPDE